MFGLGGDESRVPKPILERHHYWVPMRAVSWSRLDEPERHAWQAHASIDGQINLRETFYNGPKDKKGEQLAVLDGAFADTVCRSWLGVPEWQMPRVWAGVRTLHDLRWQGGREHAALCWHVDQPLAFAAGARLPGGRMSCKRCAVRWRCVVCWVEGVWHSHGSD